ncbi:MAG TPA: hypothetical protein VFM54_16380 [Micromonosporaceae bacterium]|nr:hypothetical protein [Micromonosporaceae bacterium]
MSKAEDIDDITGRSVAEMEQIAEDLYEHRDELGGDEAPVEQVSEVRSVVSVRFSRGELDDIAAAAALAGQPLSTYIRNAALAAAGAVDLETARRELHVAARALTELGRSLGAAA